MNTAQTKRTAGAAGILLALALTASGCSGAASGESAQGGGSQSASAAVAATTAPAATDPATPAASAPDAAGPATGKNDDALVIDKLLVKAGETLHVSGGSLPPGITVKVYTSEVGTISYNQATGMYNGSPEVFITEPVNLVVDAQGHFDTDVVIPAGTAPQTINVQLILPDGNGHMVRASVI